LAARVWLKKALIALSFDFAPAKQVEFVTPVRENSPKSQKLILRNEQP